MEEEEEVYMPSPKGVEGVKKVLIARDKRWRGQGHNDQGRRKCLKKAMMTIVTKKMLSAPLLPRAEKIFVLLSESVKIFGVSCMRDFFGWFH